MAPSVREEAKKLRRKSINLFSRNSLQINTDVYDDSNAEVEKKERKKLNKRASIFSIGPLLNLDVDHGQDTAHSPSLSPGDTPKVRNRTLQKPRPTSIFGSLGRKSMTYVDEDEVEDFINYRPESSGEGSTLEPTSANHKMVLFHGEVQTESGMFRKKKEYLVLTDTHLIRFKSQQRASDTFPTIPPFPGHRQSIRHPSNNSVGSLHEVQSNHSYVSAEGESRISLSQIVTAYRVEDGRPFFTTEVVYLDEEYHGVGSVQLMLYDPKDADLWLSSIKGAAQKARLLQTEPYPQRIIRYIIRLLEGLHDYDPNHFQVFRVVRRSPAAKGGRSSTSDDMQKMGGTVFYMVIGINSLHLVPVPDFTDASGRLMVPKNSRHTHGIVSLFQINMLSGDDRFELAFRMPMQPVKVLELAAFASYDIVAVVSRVWQYLRPLWIDRSFLLKGLGDQTPLNEGIVIPEEEEYGGFERTLVAHCSAYNCNPANIQYSVDWDVEDAPEFRLYPPALTKNYSVFELLSVMRALRYNNAFHSISFKDVDLHSMHGVTDEHGTDHVAYTSRNNIHIMKYPNINPQIRSVLYREVQALALKSSSLRRLDFTNTLPRRRPTDAFDMEGREIDKDPGCEIVAALLPLCGKKMTNVSWIVLSGVELGETDLEEMIPALNERASRIRAIECSRCGLTDRGIIQLLGNLEKQNATLECINISDNSGRIELGRFSSSMSRFSRIRKLDLSRITTTSGGLPLFAPEVLLSWSLEELIMNGIPINDKSLDAIAAYLSSEKSNSLRVLQMEQCNLNGDQVAKLMRAMARSAGKPRELQLHVSANNLQREVGEIAKAIEENHTPSHLVMRMIEFEKEDHFRQILESLRTNTTIRVLDISKASLPYDANQETCDTLRSVFAENTTLEDLDISGEQAHLEVTRFGIGLNHALTGLKANTTLKVLRIEHQNLGMEGANTLSSVLEENMGLTHIHCEHNDINLQGFTIIVNALATNYSILEFPFMYTEQDASMRRLSVTMNDTRLDASKSKRDHRPSIRRTLSALGAKSSQSTRDLTPQDVDAVVMVLQQRWETEFNRMARFLDRNRKIADGLDGYGPGGEFHIGEDVLRPTTALSDRGILESVLNSTTPRADLPNPVVQHMSEKVEEFGLQNIVEGDERTPSIYLSDTSKMEDESGKPSPIEYKPVDYLGEGGTQLPVFEHSTSFFDLDDPSGDFFKMDS
ncbi:hypothetical protein HYFRA_00005197 [Hymenoscyphus fraxineus]|uniref:LRR-containing protein second PH domain-containing protein n=1 Tax=Hymenoscyphus fraxineus TaxID=746836 RepID=A0A9N9PW73_9HELO|nr:hypothetical protein HYFRA_00005197 [Hymenoscyphus fraxineus]